MLFNFNDIIINKFINLLMLDGKKSKAEKIIFNIFIKLKKEKKNPLKIIIKAINNSKPLIRLKIQKKRKLTKIIPVPIREKKQITYAINSIIKLTKQKQKNKFENQLFIELLNAYNNTGTLIEQKKILYKKANENKSFIFQNKRI